MEKLVVGSRGSRLALLQAEHIISRLQEFAPATRFYLKEIKTMGDKILDVALSKIGDKGLFVKEIENALLQQEIDIAVHSMKDLPTLIPAGLKVGAIEKREDPRDVIISNGSVKLSDLPPGADVGTGSLRRVAQLSHFRPDLNFKPVRGNLDTRLRKLKEQEFSALVLAYAGIKRLDLQEEIAEIIPVNICLPAVGQGALGIEMRDGDKAVTELLKGIDDAATHAAVMAERAFLRRLEGGCQVPIGALGEITNGKLRLQGLIASLDGTELLRDTVSGQPERAADLGVMLAERLLSRGGDAILEKVRREFNQNE